MGYSSEAIFIKPELTKSEIQNLLTVLTGEEHVEVATTTISHADRRDKFGVYIGSINGSTIFICDELNWNRNKDTLLSETEKKIVDVCPKHELLSIANFESSNSYNYHLISEGKTVRLKSGYHPDVEYDIGDELEIEKSYYVKREIVDGVSFYYLKSYSNPDELEKYTHDQIGGAVAFEMTKLFTGLNYNSGEMLDVNVTQYISKSTFNSILAKFENPKINSTDLHRHWDNKVPIDFFNQLIKQFEPFLKAKGFSLNSDTNQFCKENGRLKYIIDFRVMDQGNYFLTPFFEYRIETNYLEWHKSSFGRDKRHSGNSVTDSLYLKTDGLGLTIQQNPIFYRSYDFNTLISKIEEKLSNEVFMLFDAVKTFQDAIKLSQGLIKVDLMILSGDTKSATDEFLALLDKTLVDFIKTNAHEKRIKEYFNEYNDRANLLGISVNLNERLDQKREEINRQKESEINKEHQPPQNTSVKGPVEVNSKPWWRFW